MSESERGKGRKGEERGGEGALVTEHAKEQRIYTQHEARLAAKHVVGTLTEHRPALALDLIALS